MSRNPRYSPADLPPVTSVEVVVLRNVDAPLVSESMQAAAALTGVTVTGESARRIAALWRQLPPGEMARCHIPTYGLRFHDRAGVVCQASVCWECNNAYGEAGGEPMSFPFDADAPVSRELLAEVQRAAGGRARPE